MTTEITEDHVLKMDIEELWNMILQIEETGEVTEKEMDTIKNGNKIIIPIWYFTQEWYEIYPSSKKVKIEGHGKYKLNEFMNEKDHREKIMRNIIIESITKDQITKPRVQ